MEDIFKLTIVPSCNLLKFFTICKLADLEWLILEVAILCGPLDNLSSIPILLQPAFFFSFAASTLLPTQNPDYLRTVLLLNLLDFILCYFEKMQIISKISSLWRKTCCNSSCCNCTSEAAVVKRLVHQTLFTCPMTTNCLR